jgi:hypothetical protein
MEHEHREAPALPDLAGRRDDGRAPLERERVGLPPGERPVDRLRERAEVVAQSAEVSHWHRRPARSVRPCGETSLTWFFYGS